MSSNEDFDFAARSGITARSPMNSSGRRTHRKSRTGCGRCKKRKIKCDELKPTCTNCLKHSAECDILLTSSNSSSSPRGVSVHTDSSVRPDAFQPSLDPSRGASAVQNWQQAAALNLLDLELLHNFSTSTCYTLHNDPTLKTLWRINVPQLGLDYDFVMRGILALSALHLGKSRPEHKERYVSLALLHSAAGLRAVTAILPNITKENCSAIYLFSALTFILALATPRKPGDLLIMGDSGPAEWLTLFRGVHVIVQSSQGNIESGILGPMFTSGARRSQLRDAYASEHSTDKDQLGYLRYAIQQTVTNQHILQIYMNTINELQISFTAAYSGVFDALESTDVFIFLFRVSEDYLVLLEDRTQESLAIFAYFAVLAKRLEGNWWCEGWSDYLMSKIYTLLDDEHKLWIRWPMEETGWIPPRETYHK